MRAAAPAGRCCYEDAFLSLPQLARRDAVIRCLALLTATVVSVAGYHGLEQWGLTPDAAGGAVPATADATPGTANPAPAGEAYPGPPARRSRFTRGYLRFAAYANLLACDLYSGRLGLDEACERVIAASSVHYPEYLARLEYDVSGLSLREKVAANLLEKLRGQLDDPLTPGGYAARRLARLEGEYSELRLRQGSGDFTESLVIAPERP